MVSNLRSRNISVKCLQEFARSTKMVNNSLVCDEVTAGTNALALCG